MGTLLQQLLEAEQWKGPCVHKLTQYNCLLIHESHLEQQGEELSGQQGQGLAGSWLALEYLPSAQEHKCVHGAGPSRWPPAGEGAFSWEEILGHHQPIISLLVIGGGKV
jgi:hypothetical protein